MSLDKPFGIKIIGGLEIIIGVIAGIYFIFCIEGILGTAIAALYYGATAFPFIFLIPLGIGILRLKRWARLSSIIFNSTLSLLLFFFLFLTFYSLSIQKEKDSDFFFKIISFLLILFILSSLSIVVYLSHSRIKKYFILSKETEIKLKRIIVREVLIFLGIVGLGIFLSYLGDKQMMRHDQMVEMFRMIGSIGIIIFLFGYPVYLLVRFIIWSIKH